MAAPTTTNRKLYDANLADILQDVRRVDSFLDVIFEFLCRRTDFYHVMEHENDVMGLPPGVAKKLVMQSFMKYDLASASRPPKLTSESICDLEAKPGDTAFVENVVEVTTEEIKEAGNSGNLQRIDDPQTDKQTKTIEGTDTTINRATQVKSDKILTAADTYNGAKHENYCWSQTLTDVDLKVFVPNHVKKGKEVLVEIKNKSIKVSTKQDENSVLLDGQLVNDVHSEECMWSLHPGIYVQLTLEKKVQTWWKSVFVGEPEIDQKSIDNTVNIHEMDADSQTDYNRVMFDMEQKRLGKPTSKEIEAHKMLKEAWNAKGSPFAGSDFDPSIVNIST